MLFEALASGGGSDWYYTILMKAPLGSDITIDDGDEEVTAEGAGDTIIGIPVHNPSSTYNISVVASGFTKTSSATTPATSGGISSLIEVQFGEIDLIFDDEFRGLSATIENEAGTKTSTITLPAIGNTDTLFVPDLGKWIISSTVSGDTFTAEATIGSYSVPETAELVVVPNGKTVLPVNDIPKWLLCGNIKNKSYTTLAEVLADEDTLRKLLTDDNAIDYLKRSTEWAAYENLVPVLSSSYSWTDGNLIYDSDQTGYEAYKAFNGVTNTNGWNTASGATGDLYIGCHFNTPVEVGKVKYYSVADGASGNTPVTFKVQGSNDGFTSDIHDLSDVVGGENINTGSVEVRADNKYSDYRLIKVSGSNCFSAWEVEFYPANLVDSELAMSYIGAYDYAADELLSDATWVEAIFESEYRSKVLATTVPTMTSNTTPSGVVSATSEYGDSYKPWKAFDNDDSTAWCSSRDNAVDNIGYQFDNSVKVIGFDLYPVYSTSAGTYYNYVKSFKLQGSNDGFMSDEHDLTETKLLSNSDVGKVSYCFSNDEDYIYYRLKDVTTHAPNNEKQIRTLQFYGREAGGVQNLLKLAGIDRPYTTIEELLADHEALQSVISSHDAIDYLVETKAFIKEITSDATAMRYIGKRNYAANTLLADANPGLVPILSSNTSQIIKVSESSSEPAWKAFDGDSTTGWNSGSSCVNPDYGYLGYDFEIATKVREVYVKTREDNVNTVIKVQGSNDGFVSDIHDLSEFATLTPGANEHAFILDNDTNYRYYRVYGRTEAANYGFYIYTLQFYAQPVDEPQWFDAIATSPYWDSVFNVNVPIMTDDTHPEGHATAGGTNTRAYQAFDRNLDDGPDVGYGNNGTTANSWFQYEFPAAVCVTAMRMAQGVYDGYAGYTFKIQASNDGSTWVDFKSSDYTMADKGTLVYKGFSVNNITAYSKWRVQFLTSKNGYKVMVRDIQFMTRQDVDETLIGVYSAANDTFYQLDASGNADIIDTTDSNGYAAVPRTDLPNGVHTLYSTVAKNPNDLTVDYFKTVKVTNDTIEVMIMPDDVLYWNGYKGENLEEATSANGWSVNGASVGGPTFNTNSARCDCGGNSSIWVGLGTKETVSDIAKAHIIGKGVTAHSQGWYGSLVNTASKSNINSNEIREDLIRSSSLEKLGIDVNDGSYLWTGALMRTASDINAFWVEPSNKIPTYLSAANDILYILDGNRQIPIATTNAEGKSFDALLEPGTYTIYSSVAKNPTNVNQPYGKEVTITAATQTVKVMPENVLYWWGYESANLEDLSSANGWSWSQGWNGTPIHNTNNITMTGAGSLSIQGVGSKYPVAYTSVMCICESTSSASGYTQFGTQASKNIGDSSAVIEVVDIQNGFNTVSTSGTGYVRAATCGNGNTTTLDALWYE